MVLSTSAGYMLYTWGIIISMRYASSQNVLLSRFVKGLRVHNFVQISCCCHEHCAVLVDPSPSSIRQSQQAQFNNKEHSDVTFMVENIPIYGNMDVLSRKSQYFKGMFRSNMRESISRVVEVCDVSAGVFLKLLEYLCLDGFVLDGLDDSVRGQLGDVADMYLVEGLRLLCECGVCFDHKHIS